MWLGRRAAVVAGVQAGEGESGVSVDKAFTYEAEFFLRIFHFGLV